MLKMAAKLRLTSGPLLIAYQTPRDSIVAPWPGLEVDAPLYGGMSGGPVIDAQGCVVALGSRSPNLGPGEEPSPMMAALIWPTLAQKFSADCGQLTSLLELNGHHTVITGSDALRVSYGSTGELEAVYTAWT